MLSPDCILGPEIWDEIILVPEPREKLTPAQRREAFLIFEQGFVVMPARSPRGLTRYKPLWALHNLDLVTFDFGPVGSWLKTYGFGAKWTDPVI
jgi:hypothetical protein